MADDPDILVPLTTAKTEFEAETIAEALRSKTIPAEVFGTAARVGQWEFGINNDVKVMVRRADLDRAREALRAEKLESANVDWSRVDVGAPPADVADPARAARPTPFLMDRRRHLAAMIVIALLVVAVIVILRWAAPGLFAGRP